jgi:hypothetical protein
LGGVLSLATEILAVIVDINLMTERPFDVPNVVKLVKGKMLLLTENKDTDLMDTAAEIPHLEILCFNRLSLKQKIPQS